MQELRKIWAFGIPYLKPYRFRFVLGIVLSMFFGLSNGLFVLSVNTLFNRLAPPHAMEAVQNKSVTNAVEASVPTTPKRESFSKRLKKEWGEKIKPVGEQLKSLPDKWLPRMGQPVTWQQMLGGFFLLPLVMGGRAMASYFSTYCLTWRFSSGCRFPTSMPASPPTPMQFIRP
ncbi:MAG: hypothetical protein EBT50_08380 [Verrucomicrobia bacterium]|nr:hypothetical protein [Verrucomicrobiota bacterium]